MKETKVRCKQESVKVCPIWSYQRPGEPGLSGDTAFKATKKRKKNFKSDNVKLWFTHLTQPYTE